MPELRPIPIEYFSCKTIEDTGSSNYNLEVSWYEPWNTPKLPIKTLRPFTFEYEVKPDGSQAIVTIERRLNFTGLGMRETMGFRVRSRMVPVDTEKPLAWTDWGRRLVCTIGSPEDGASLHVLDEGE